MGLSSLECLVKDVGDGERRRAYVLISSEEILIEDPEGEEGIRRGQLNLVHTAPVEAAEPSGGSDMRVCCLRFIIARA